MTGLSDGTQRLRLRVQGAVQGVGFRPFVYRLAATHGVAGFVKNDGDGVVIEIEGCGLDDFVRDVTGLAPSLSTINSVSAEAVAPTGQAGFAILASDPGGQGARIPADTAMCEACGDDLFDPASRFYHYPFVTCTQCGPRYTITHGLPFDRARTSLARFALCPDCQRDYADPRQRRHHAEALACPVCGPRLSHDMAAIMAVLDAGRIVAVKGIGGFHLMADARREDTVARLRRAKHRDAKPFAVMVANGASAARLVRLSDAERGLLNSRARPIVVTAAKDHGLAPSVVPDLAHLGLMLPYTPLHHLIFQWGRPNASRADREAPSDRVLIATSANLAGKPLISIDAEAIAELGPIADLVVTHDRPIVARTDDSVMAVVGERPFFIRRARGFAPDPIDLGVDGPPVLALGAHLKATLTLTRGREAFVSTHIGSLDNAETVRFYEETLAQLRRLTGVEPQAVACDLHPDLFTTRLAERLGLPVIRVQHHAAHVAAVAAEHQVTGLFGLALDGYGYGPDGSAWGGEAIALTGAQWGRAGHLAPLPFIGGDRAARQPWRMGLAALVHLGRLDQISRLPPEASAMARLIEGRRQPATTSLGRIFDAAAALLGLCPGQKYGGQGYEGQAAMMLEALVETPRFVPGAYRIESGVLDLSPLLALLLDPGCDAQTGAELFHGTLAQALADWVTALCPTGPVALTGGCMMNRVLSQCLNTTLSARGFQVLNPRAVPANDGGLSLGQAHLARQILIQEGA